MTEEVKKAGAMSEFNRVSGVSLDGLFADIARDAVKRGYTAISTIQRNYGVGFNRAERIMSQLESAGIVGPQMGKKPREIKFHDIPSLEAKLRDLGLSDEEFDECSRLQSKRYWEWVLADSEKEEARFKELQRMDDAWRRDLEERIEKDEDEPNDTPDYPGEETPEELEACMARESQEWHLSLRHGMSEDDWQVYQRLIRKRNMRLWLDFLSDNVDFDYHWLLRVLQFKINRMVDYWQRFSHLANGDYIRAQMELAARLIDVVLHDGNECGDDEKFPYCVNVRNKHRFSVRFQGAHYLHGERQQVRFSKAYCLLFKLLSENLLHWWD